MHEERKVDMALMIQEYLPTGFAKLEAFADLRAAGADLLEGAGLQHYNVFVILYSCFSKHIIRST